MAKKIRKIRQTNPILLELSKVSNEYNESTEDTYSCEYINKLNEYSEEETVIGTWIDGKPIYRKVITYENTLGQYLTRTINISQYQIENIVNYYSTLRITRTDKGGYQFHNPFYNSASEYWRSWVNNYDNLNFEIRLSGSVPFKIFTVLEYTKTTD